MSRPERFPPLLDVTLAMQGVLVSFEAPEDWWARTLTGRFRDLNVSIVSIVAVRDRFSLQTVRLEGPSSQPAIDWLMERGVVARSRVLARGPDTAIIHLMTYSCPLVDLIAKAGVAPELPMVVAAGRVRWLILEQTDRARMVLNCLERDGLQPRVIRSGEWSPVIDDLTPHQREVLDLAVGSGFYDAPRRITLTALAGAIGVSKSTLSETLIAIESKVMNAHRRGAALPVMRPSRLHDPRRTG